MLQKDDVLKERYTIIKLLGQGGTAKTYVAKDIATQKNVVLKVINLRDIDDWKIIDLFEREINVLKALDHPFIPDYIDNFKVDLKGRNLYVLVQEYVDGDTLENLVKKGKRFSTDEIQNIFKNLLKILIYIHNLHPPVIHRDINPKNLIINKEGNIYVVDFGAVGSIIKDTIAAARSDTFVGTVGYMAHEQFFGKALPASDLYALGMTIVYLFTGIEPFKMELDGMSINLDAYSNIPDNLKVVLRKMIEPDYKKRLQSPRKVLDFLEGNTQLPGSQLVIVSGNRIKIKEVNSKEKLIIFPGINSISSFRLLIGGVCILASMYVYIHFFSFGIPQYILFVPVIIGITGFYLLFNGCKLIINKKDIHLTEKKISVVKIRAGFIKTTGDLFLKAYKGLKTRQIGNVKSKPVYEVSIIGDGKILSGEFCCTKEEIEFLKETIENHIAHIHPLA